MTKMQKHPKRIKKLKRRYLKFDLLFTILNTNKLCKLRFIGDFSYSAEEDVPDTSRNVLRAGLAVNMHILRNVFDQQ